MISEYERLIITAVAILLSLSVSLAIFRKEKMQGFALTCSTLALTGVLLGFYHLGVRDPAHGMGILILPLATGWLWWRKQNVGRPNYASGTFIFLQALLSAAYLLAAWFQEN